MSSQGDRPQLHPHSAYDVHVCPIFKMRKRDDFWETTTDAISLLLFLAQYL